MIGIAAVRSSGRSAGNGKGATGARQNGIHRRAVAPMARFAGLLSANTRASLAQFGLISALTAGTVSGGYSNGGSRLKNALCCTIHKGGA